MTTLAATTRSPAIPSPPAHSSSGGLASAFGIDLRSLAVFRIGLGGLLLTDVLLRTRLFAALYTDAGVLPRAALRAHPWAPGAWSLHALGGTVAFEAALFGLAGLAAVALLVGWRTRLATVLSWLLLVSLHHRNPLVLNAGDALLSCVLFWAMFLPLGAHWALDAPRARPSAPTVLLSPATAALRLQVVVMYLVTAALKWSPEWYRDGTAIHYALSLDAMATPLGVWLRQYPAVLHQLTGITIALEAVGPLVVLLVRGRARLVVVAAFVGLHLGCGLTLYLGLFTAICIVAWAPFLPSDLWVGPAPRLVRAARPGATLAIVAAGLLVLRWNASTLPGAAPVTGTEHRALYALGLRQSWRMFAPRPLREDGWYVAAATTADGRAVDLLRDGAPLAWSRPQEVAGTYHMDRWRKYLLHLYAPALAVYRAPLLAYLCRQHPEAVRVELVFLLTPTALPGIPRRTTPFRLEARDCARD